ncbi:MAG: indole-3-glycerol-phosphate synthase [Mailhella sp.]|nr:indole-3-glycerol-phosphate synthase [Mailhella sp.]
MELERFYKAKLSEITALENGGAEKLKPWPLPRACFSEALRRHASGPLPVIAEFKKASPSRGRICDALEPEEAARQFADNGAAAISVLTEETWFKGHISYLERIACMMRERSEPPLPMLRKDFIFHPGQVAATLSTPASAMLLIVRLIPDAKTLRDLREQAERGGVECVVEVFSRRDVELARKSGARIIQVNARDLETFKVDTRAALRFIDECPPENDELWIAASGITSNDDLCAAANAGYHAALIGSALMEGCKPGMALSRMLGRLRDGDASC